VPEGNGFGAPRGVFGSTRQFYGSGVFWPEEAHIHDRTFAQAGKCFSSPTVALARHSLYYPGEHRIGIGLDHMKLSAVGGDENVKVGSTEA